MLAGAGGLYSWWLVGFWDALAIKSLPAFGISLLVFSALTVSVYFITILHHYIIEFLEADWRDSLTKSFVEKYLNQSEPKTHPDYLVLSRQQSIDNVQQRIQEDIKLYVHTSLHSGSSFLLSILKFIIFAKTLWSLGSVLSFTVLGWTLTIPGYLVWMAIIYSLLGVYMMKNIGEQLPDINVKQKQLEADLVTELALVKQQAENIALEKAEVYHHQRILNKLAQLKENVAKRIEVKIPLMGFQKLHGDVSSIFSYLAAAPLYFSGLMELGQVMQVGYSFRSVFESLNWFMTSYETISVYEASMARLIELENACLPKQECVDGNLVKYSYSNEYKDVIELNDLSLQHPGSSQYIFEHLNVTFKKGEHTYIYGPSGIGKSMLYKAIAHRFTKGNGEITLPLSKFCFISQKPYFPCDSLKAVMAYPHVASTYEDKNYRQALRNAGLPELISDLDSVKDWSIIPEGQKQSLVFSRAYLQRPDWLFLDEATSSLEASKRDSLYQMLQNELPDMTYISISQDSSVQKHHSRILSFEKKVSEETVVAAQTMPRMS